MQSPLSLWWNMCHFNLRTHPHIWCLWSDLMNPQSLIPHPSFFCRQKALQFNLFFAPPLSAVSPTWPPLEVTLGLVWSAPSQSQGGHPVFFLPPDWRRCCRSWTPICATPSPPWRISTAPRAWLTSALWDPGSSKPQGKLTQFFVCTWAEKHVESEDGRGKVQVNSEGDNSSIRGQQTGILLIVEIAQEEEGEGGVYRPLPLSPPSYSISGPFFGVMICLLHFFPGALCWQWDESFLQGGGSTSSCICPA